MYMTMHVFIYFLLLLTFKFSQYLLYYYDTIVILCWPYNFVISHYTLFWLFSVFNYPRLTTFVYIPTFIWKLWLL